MSTLYLLSPITLSVRLFVLRLAPVPSVPLAGSHIQFNGPKWRFYLPELNRWGEGIQYDRNVLFSVFVSLSSFYISVYRHILHLFACIICHAHTTFISNYISPCMTSPLLRCSFSVAPRQTAWCAIRYPVVSPVILSPDFFPSILYDSLSPFSPLTGASGGRLFL